MQPINESGKPFRVPRSRVFDTHKVMEQAILAAFEPVAFGSSQAGATSRRNLEHMFRQVSGHRHACGVHSGTTALFLALLAAGVGPGDEVITVANSDISTTSAILHCGGVPVLCDVRADDYTIDVSEVEKAISPRTRCILPVDLYGHPVDTRRLKQIADRHGLRIVEDAALATGAEDNGVPVGAFADLTVFSFAPFKPLGSAGNGAMVVCNDDELAERLQLLCGYGHGPGGDHVPPGHQEYIAEGFNVPLDPLQAALLSTKLSRLPSWTQRRREIAQMYTDGFRDTSALVPTFRAESAPTFRCFTIRVPDRQRIYAEMLSEGIEVVLHYCPPVYHHPGYSGPRLPAGSLPVSEQLAKELLCLPVAPELTDNEIVFVIESVQKKL